MPSEVIALRELVYTRIGIKKAALQFTYANDFEVVQTWRPWDTIERINTLIHGKVYVIGGTPGDKINESRSNMALGEFNVMVGFQHAIVNVDDLAEIDAYVNFVKELDAMCQNEIDVASVSPLFSWTRIAYLRDPDGIPLSFVGLRIENMFEAYFTASYTTIVQ